MSVPETGRRAARAVATAFGGKPEVRRYYDRDELNAIDILTCFDRPAPGLASHSTADLHLAPNLLDGVDIRVEIAGVADLAVAEFAGLLATGSVLCDQGSLARSARGRLSRARP